MGFAFRIEGIRRLAVAWLRMILAVLIVVLGPALLAGAVEAVAVYLPGIVVFSTPLAFVASLVCRREAPYLRRGYWIVAIYGPALLAVPAMLGEWRWSDVAFFAGVYEVAAPVTTAVYVGLWRLGDSFLGGLDHPRLARRWALAVALIVGAGILLPALGRDVRADDCMDRGGRVTASGGCDTASDRGR